MIIRSIGVEVMNLASFLFVISSGGVHSMVNNSTPVILDKTFLTELGEVVTSRTIMVQSNPGMKQYVFLFASSTITAINN